MPLTTTPEALVELGRLHARIAELERLCGIRAPGARPEADAPPPAYAEGLHEIVAGFAEEMVVVCDIGGQILHANPATERVLGYRPQEMIGTNAWSYVHPEDLKATATARSAPLDDGIPFENRARASDGTYRWLEFVARRWPNQDPTHVVLRFRRAPHRDAPAEGGVTSGTAKLHVQLRYAAALARLSQLALGLPLVSDLLDAATSLGANALEAGLGVWLERDGDGLRIQAETGLGAERRGSAVPLDGSLAGLAWTRRVPVDGAQLQGEPLRRDTLLAAAGAACALAVPVCGVDRVHGVLLLAGTTPRTFEPEDVHFAETVGNVLGTALDYRASQEALSRRERLTRAVFDHARDGLLIVDDDGRCVDANQAAHATLGAAPRALLGRRPADVVATSLDLASDGRTTVTAGEGTVRTGAGLRALELDRIPRIQPGLALVIVRDVT
ncbi:MAG: PAS domain S-box protein, partial [Anaeromyxobacteraceae bacterium]